MKKLLTLIIIVIVIAVTYSEKTLGDIASGDVTLYYSADICYDGVKAVKGGCYYEITLPADKAKSLKRAYPDYQGESVIVSNLEIKDILSYFAAVRIYEERIGDILFVYAYSRQLRGYQTVNGHKINLQLACLNGGIILIGTPLILGGV